MHPGNAHPAWYRSLLHAMRMPGDARVWHRAVYLAEPLRRAAPDLAVDQQRVDHGAAIVHGDQALDLDVARVAVDAHHAQRRAEPERLARRLEEAAGLQP